MFEKSSGNSWKKKLKSRKTAFVAIFLFFFLLLCIYPGSNLFTWIAAKVEISRQESQIRRLQQEIMRMDSTITKLTGNKDSLEQFARENFHFTVPGEDVYLIDEN